MARLNAIAADVVSTTMSSSPSEEYSIFLCSPFAIVMLPFIDPRCRRTQKQLHAHAEHQQRQFDISEPLDTMRNGIRANPPDIYQTR